MPDEVVAPNPFATRCVRPGAIPYLFPCGRSAGWLVERLRASGWWGQVTGAHGSGKSALVATLLPALEAAGRRPVCCLLHGGQRRLPVPWRELAGADSATLLVIDGYEQLSRWQRWRAKRFCRRRGCGLLVTAHVDVGLPPLFHTAASAETTAQIAVGLLPPSDRTIAAEDVSRLFTARRGNVRETLFDLYDLYEKRRAGGAATGKRP